MSNSSLHSDHRKRMRKRFENTGSTDFADHELLEMLLYSAIPRRNTNDIAHGLIDKCSGFRWVFTENRDNICEVSGIGDSAATHINLLGSCFDVLGAQIYSNIAIDTEDKAGMYAMLRMNLAPAESATAVYLDGNGKIIEEEYLYRGKGTMTDDLPVCVAGRGKELGAMSILLMHNHRHEPLVPSPDDKHITVMLRKEAEKNGIKNVMHVIVADDGYIHI